MNQNPRFRVVLFYFDVPITNLITVIAKETIRVNDRIRASEVRVVDPKGNHGIYPVEEALRMAEEQELDLVEISPNAEPPVVKIMDYGKYRYELQKKEKEAKKKQHTIELKEIRFRPHTDTHDFNFKTKHAKGFLEQGHKVKAYVQFRGRDIIYKDHGMEVLARFIQELEDVAKIDQAPKMEGRRMTTILSPSKKK
ncbi:MAG: translation initiation factor IF-3 [Bacteroidetes bacterium]|nr:translation initiation factor IF-3 [Bacteroidota bacterium]MDA0873648.1 translation initiation factor IF-3 [Bacteroidota bacterium]